MNPKAFVSSTFRDLHAHRARVVAELRRAGFAVDPMEDWTASTDSPSRFSQDRLDGCDLCVLLVGLRRGHVPEGETRSITQLEYQAAKDRGIDVLVFMVDEQAPWPRQFDELDKDPEVRPWRQKLMEERGVGFFEDEPESVEIGPALNRWLRERLTREAKPSTAPAPARPPATPERAADPAAAEDVAADGGRRVKPWMWAAMGVAGVVALLLVLWLVSDGDPAATPPPPTHDLDLLITQATEVEADRYAVDLWTEANRRRDDWLRLISEGRSEEAWAARDGVIDAYRLANLTALKTRGDSLREKLSAPQDAPIHDFAPALYAQAVADFEDGLEAWDADHYDLAFARLRDALETLEKTREQAEPRAKAWTTWDGFVQDYGTRRLSGASGRYLGAKFTVACNRAEDGSIAGTLTVEVGCKSNNNLIGAPGKFVVAGPALDDVLRIRCRKRDEQTQSKDYPLSEDYLLEHHPTQISVSRDFDG